MLWPTGHRLHCNFYDDPAEGLRSSLHGSPVFRCRRPMPWITSLPGAAKRYGAAIDPELPDRLMEKAPEADALPLLAFAMQRLWDQFGVRGSLRQADYRAMGGLFGLMEDAAERALYGIRPESVDEALFREWPRFWQWLEPERERLEALGGLQISVFNWMRHGGKSIF